MNVRDCLPPKPTVSQEHIDAQFVKMCKLVKTVFGEKTDRYFSIMGLFHDLEDRIKTAPASSKIHYHNAYVGGYLDHVLHVVEAAYLLLPVFERLGGHMDFTEQEMVFAALMHDLGKLGDEDGPLYFQTNDPKDNSNGTYFRYNDAGQTMSCNDRTMYLLNLYGISFNKKEMLAIKMADGLFDEGNKSQYLATGYFPHRSRLGYFLHWCDWMACISENDPLRVQFENNLKRQMSISK